MTQTSLSNVEKVAAFLLAMPSEDISQVLSFFEEDEVRDVSKAMTRLTFVNQDTLQGIFQQFVTDINRGSALIASESKIRLLLEEALGKEKSSDILAHLQEPNITTWDRLEKIDEAVLSDFLRHELPPTIATILMRLSPAYATKVLKTFPESLSAEVIGHMLSGRQAKREIVDKIEGSLRREFIAELMRTPRAASAYERVAEIFSNFDHTMGTRVLTLLQDLHPKAAKEVKALLFTMEDILRIDAAGIQVLIREADKETLALALKGASEAVSDYVFAHMTARAGKLLREDIAALGSVRVRDVEEAQSNLIVLMRALKDEGAIVLQETRPEEPSIV